MYLNARGVSYAVVTLGRWEEVAPYVEFMGCTQPWYSVRGVEEAIAAEDGRLTCYLRDGDRVYLTYSTTGRGVEPVDSSLYLLDMTPYGRREAWEDTPEGWPEAPDVGSPKGGHGAPISWFWRTDHTGPRPRARPAARPAAPPPVVPAGRHARADDGLPGRRVAGRLHNRCAYVRRSAHGGAGPLCAPLVQVLWTTPTRDGEENYDPAMEFTDQALAAREASRVLATARRDVKDQALHVMADQLLTDADAILAANAEDVARARESGTAEPMVDRLALTQSRLEGMADGLRSLARLADPVGDVVRGWTLPNGVQVRQVRVPFGVVGIIYEARPNVTADAAGICLKSGNAVLLAGSRSAERSNRAIVAALRTGLEKAGLPADAVQLLPAGREASGQLMAARGYVDVLVPRGGAGLIASVVEQSKVPVIETGTGNCHLFVDATADLAMARDILVNAKTQRPSVCNAVETVLVHEAVAAEALPLLLDALAEAGVTVHGDEAFQAASPAVVPARPEDYDGEFLTLDLAARVVRDLDEAVAHIRQHTTGHSETIVTRDLAAADRFVAEVDAAVVLVNASSRFTDGGEFGFGAEIGISTQKLHARGPMALPEMTSTKYVLTGTGQTRP